MIGELAQKAQSASPTPFHHWLRRLDDCGQLLRVYTQNIDCLEMKCGISFGLPTPSLDLKTGKRKTRHHKMLSSNWHLPRCIPLHGRIDFVHCLLCKESYPIAPFTGTFMRGTLPLCPRCELVEELRPFTEKRSRGVGQLRPSVVLYNETHSSGDILGDIITHDLKLIRDRLRSDDIVVLIVVGTSLQISGTKSMVRKFAKILHAPPINRLPNGETKDSSSLTVQSVYLNLDFPSTGRDWEGVFDAWVCGDIQEFSRTMLARYDGE
jgi:NAD-dependent SIR2 family protein deacetylase